MVQKVTTETSLRVTLVTVMMKALHIEVHEGTPLNQHRDLSRREAVGAQLLVDVQTMLIKSGYSLSEIEKQRIQSKKIKR